MGLTHISCRSFPSDFSKLVPSEELKNKLQSLLLLYQKQKEIPPSISDLEASQRRIIQSGEERLKRLEAALSRMCSLCKEESSQECESEVSDVLHALQRQFGLLQTLTQSKPIQAEKYSIPREEILHWKECIDSLL